MSVSIEKHSLYVVATPIGNLADISQRALSILGQVDLIAAEDTRHSGQLLRHFVISTPCVALHEHNERQATGKLISKLQSGAAIALISDAGTPLLSDPGAYLVRDARSQGIKVIPIPGPSALITALSVAGLPTQHFVFEGFLPAKSAARRQALQQLVTEPRTLIFYEAPHRILACLEDMRSIFGDTRHAVVARELTKHFETIKGDTLKGLYEWIEADSDQRRGEIVLLLHGAAVEEKIIDSEIDRILKILLAELSTKQACKLTAEISGIKRNVLYQYALTLQDNS